MSHFTLQPTDLPGVTLVQRRIIGDARGYLGRMFCAEELAAVGWQAGPAQVNRTLTSQKGAVRGMHFQYPPHAEKKLVSCLRGAVFDVAVDLRAGSATFGQWTGAILSDDNRHSLHIPEGFAHGFQALTEDAELLYCHSTFYAPDHEAGVLATDPDLGIDWPEPITQQSDRDLGLARLSGIRPIDA